MGTRLGRSLPKPLTPLAEGRSILQRQLDGLRSVLGEQVPVTVVVGYRADLVREAASGVAFVDNPDYATTNTSRSLLQALESVPPGGVLWLNGDVVFDPALLEQVRPLLEADVSFVCVNTASVADEEVKYTVDEQGWVAELSKTVVGGLGEAVGINHVSSADRRALVEHLRGLGDQEYFERGMELAIRAGAVRFRPVDISRYTAVEVDVEADLDLANHRLAGGPRHRRRRDVADGPLRAAETPRPGGRG
jgi:CDP-glycerol glycerophosphotransferase